MKRMIFLTAVAAIMLSSCDIHPEASFYTDKISAEVGEEIFFTNSSYNASHFEWDFGDGTWSDAFNAVHSYSGSGTFTVVLSAFSSSGNVDKAYADIEILSPTMLEVEVLEWWDQYPVQGASVILYPTETDWDNQTNAIVEGFTNSSGKVIFTDLGPYVYYIDIWHETHNNYMLRDEDVDFIRTYQLNKNELNQFIGWVDYTGTKSASGRDRTVLVPSKNRTFSATKRK